MEAKRPERGEPEPGDRVHFPCPKTGFSFPLQLKDWDPSLAF